MIRQTADELLILMVPGRKEKTCTSQNMYSTVSVITTTSNMTTIVLTVDFNSSMEAILQSICHSSLNHNLLMHAIPVNQLSMKFLIAE